MLNKLLLLLSIIFSFSVNAETSSAINSENPEPLIKSLSQQLTNALGQLQKTATREEEVKTIVAQIVMPHVDTKYVAYAVLGKHLKKATKAQRIAFHDAFKNHLIETYARTLSRFDDQEIEVLPQRSKTANKRMVSVYAQIMSGANEPIDIYFKLRKSKKTNQWKVFDFAAEGISLLHTKHKEFSNLINQQGIDGAIAYLEEK